MWRKQERDQVRHLLDSDGVFQTFWHQRKAGAETLRFALFRHDHIKFDLDPASHTAKLRIINDAINRWVHVPPLASKMTVLQHISWADPPKSFEQQLEDNRKLQLAIDKEHEQYGYRKIV